MKAIMQYEFDTHKPMMILNAVLESLNDIRGIDDVVYSMKGNMFMIMDDCAMSDVMSLMSTHGMKPISIWTPNTSSMSSQTSKKRVLNRVLEGFREAFTEEDDKPAE